MNVLTGNVIPILLIWIVFPSHAGAEVLDRLFFTPQERVTLEQLRWAPAESLAAPDRPEEEAAPQEAQPLFLTLDGIVSRLDGTQRVWLNGVSYPATALPEHVRLSGTASGGRIEVLVEQKGKTYSLRSGQTLDLNSGEIREAYERGPEPAPAAPDIIQESSSPQQPPAAAEKGQPVPPIPGQSGQ